MTTKKSIDRLFTFRIYDSIIKMEITLPEDVVTFNLDIEHIKLSEIRDMIMSAYRFGLQAGFAARGDMISAPILPLKESENHNDNQEA